MLVSYLDSVRESLPLQASVDKIPIGADILIKQETLGDVNIERTTKRKGNAFGHVDCIRARKPVGLLQGGSGRVLTAAV